MFVPENNVHITLTDALCIRRCLNREWNRLVATKTDQKDIASKAVTMGEIRRNKEKMDAVIDAYHVEEERVL